MNPNIPPQNPQAEAAVLGAVLISSHAYATVRSIISDDDWYRPANATVWAAMNTLTKRGDAVDMHTVERELTHVGKLANVGGAVYLANLSEAVLTATNVSYHAKIVAETGIRRRLIEVMGRIAQYAYEGQDSIEELLAKAQAEMTMVGALRNHDGPIPGLYSYPDFIAKYAGRPNSWVVPGFIMCKDVWMILAPAGAGKTTLSRQLCWGIAAGVHPFRPERSIEPKRTLLVDLENDEGMGADESGEFFGRFDSLGDGVEDRAWIYARPQGLNIRKAEDAARLDDVITRANPDIVMLGSLYKSFMRSGDWDQSAGEAREVFDTLRAKHQIAFWIEHHMPKAQDGGRKPTPFGSSVWEWWPSHGRVLERTSDDNHKAPYRFSAPFRGDRGARECPVGFTRGGRIPWTPIWDEEELDYLIDGAT